MPDLSYTEAVIMGEQLAAKGAKVYFKFTCDHCGTRVSFSEPLTIYHSGECVLCGHITEDIQGYGLLTVFDNTTLSGAIEDIVQANPRTKG